MARTQRSIHAFGRISKANSTEATAKKRKASPEPADLAADAFRVNNDRVKRRKALITPVDTPTRGISLKFARLELAQRSVTPNGKERIHEIAKWTTFQDTPPTSPSPSHGGEQQDVDRRDLPAEIGELKALNSALLTALSLHYAHHGTASPLDIRRLTPSVTRLWGKRKVILTDIERCLGLLQSSQLGHKSPFQLFEYNGGRIYIELISQSEQAPVGTHFDQDGLLELFDQRIEQSWFGWIKQCGEPDSKEAVERRVASFIDQLSRAKATLAPNARKTAQALSLAKGHKRLRDVLDGRSNGNHTKHEAAPSKRRKTQDKDLANASAAPVSMSVSAPAAITSQVVPSLPAQPTATTSNRGQSLLERIRTKQMQAASMPAAATKEQVARMAALQRIEDLASILDMLVTQRGQGPRASFPIASLTQSIQNSLRSPMSKEEVSRCLSLMQNEIAVGYVKVLRMGAMSGVIVDVSQKPRKEILVERLKANGV